MAACQEEESIIMDGDDVEELVIQNHLETYKKDLVQLIDYRDLLFYKYFDSIMRKRFREQANHGFRETVTCEMIDTILAMTTVTNRFVTLRKLFEEEFENEKVVRILKGDKVPCNRSKNKETICDKMRDICENIDIPALVPELIKRKLIISREGEQLLQKAKYENNFDAALDLVLHRLPCRHPNWYPRFIKCLIVTKHEELASSIDTELCQKLTDALHNNGEADGSVTSDQTIEDMSLGPKQIRERYEELKRHNMTLDGLRRQDTETYSDTTPKDVTNRNDKKKHETDLSKKSPSDERVQQWLMRPINTNNTYNKKTRGVFRKNKFSSRKRVKNRASSLVKNSDSPGGETALASTITRFQTVQVPYSQGPNKTDDGINKIDSEEQWDEECSSICSRYEDENLDSLCVDYAPNMVKVKSEQTENEVIEKGESKSDSYETELKNENKEDREDEEHEDCPNKDSRKVQEISGRGKMKGTKFRFLDQILCIANLHPAMLVRCVKKNKELLNMQSHLQYSCKRTHKLEDDVSSLKCFYVSYILEQIEDAKDIDAWLDKTLTGREDDGCHEFLDGVVRHMLSQYPYQESPIVKKLQTVLKSISHGYGLACLRILIQALSGNDISEFSNSLEINNSNQTNHIEHTAEKEQVCCMASVKSRVVGVVQIVERLHLKPIKPDVGEYYAIRKLISNAVKVGKGIYIILAIDRIDDQTSLGEYNVKKGRINTKHGKANERLLFANETFVKVVLNGQMCEDRTKDNKHEYYFTSNPMWLQAELDDTGGTTANQKGSDCDWNTHRYLLLCRVCLGNVYSSASCTKPIQEYYHSTRIGYHGELCDGMQFEGIKYVVSSLEQVCPEYLVSLRTYRNGQRPMN